ncbi:MAG: response regulator [Alphaproteobacteria bacterium]|nr:response regulator [Alphaproteobacteria bacterium]
MRRVRILLVDDNRVNRKLLAAVLEADGYRVDEAGSGREAVEGVRLLPYDLVLMDIQMADMDGVAATTAIRALGGRRGEVPIVAITGDIEGDVAERCRRAGMNEHLAKPVSPSALQQAVARWAKAEGQPASAGGSGGEVASGLGGLAAHLAGAALLPVIDDFTAGAEIRVAEIERQAAAGDLARVRPIAHDLSGTAANLGLTALSQVARSIETACIEAKIDTVRRLLPETRTVLEFALRQLATERQRAAQADAASGEASR